MRKIRLILSLLLTILSSSIMGNNTDYSSKWNEVDDLMNSPLLKDAQKLVDEIRVAATKEKDELNILRCEVYNYAIDLGCEYNITSESRVHPGNANREEGEDIIIKHYKKASELKDAFKSPVNKACCELFMAEMLENFIQVMDRQSGAVSTVKEDESKKFNAEDLREMSFENIRNIIRTHVDNIIKEKESLLSTSSEKYIPLFVDNNAITDDLKETRPSVFDAMLQALISFRFGEIRMNGMAKQFYFPIHVVQKDLLKKNHLNSIFADVINYHLNKKEYSAALSAELLRLGYVENSFEDIEYKTKIETLDSLISQYGDKTSCILNAVVKKQEIMCDMITKTYIDENVTENFPKLIIDEIEKYAKLFPNNETVERLRKNEKWLKNIKINGYVDKDIVNKGTDVEIRLSYANVEVVYADIYRVEATPLECAQTRDFSSISKKFLMRKEFKLEKTNYIFDKNTIINIGNDFEYGKYLVFLHNKKEKDSDSRNYLTFDVTDLALLDVYSADEKRDVYVVDGKTGYPVKDASVERYESENRTYNLVETQNTSAEGKAEFSLPDDKYYLLYAKKGDDIYNRVKNVVRYNVTADRSYYKTKILTDRNIYRPGQTVEGKVILTHLSVDEETVVANKKINLVLKDANYEKAEEIDVMTNEFGSAAFRFTIPTDRMNGTFVIQSAFIEGKERSRETANIEVESYKLPVAEVNVAVKDGSSMMFDHKLEFVGEVKTLSGEAIAGAVIKFRIEKNSWFIAEEENILFSGETKSGDDGKYSIVSESAFTKDMESSGRIFVDAILPSGETFSTSQLFQVSTAPLTGRIGICNDGSDFDKRETMLVRIDLNNYEKVNEEAEAVLTISTKEDKGNNVPAKTLITRKVKGTNNIKENFDLSSFASAIYEIHLKTLSGETLDHDEFTVYDKESSELPKGIDYKIWYVHPNKKCTSTKDAEIVIGSAEKNAQMLVIVRDEDDKIINREWIGISNELKRYKVPYKKYFANNKNSKVRVEFIMVRQQQMYESSIEVTRENDKAKSEIEVLEIVRKIVPGEKQKVKMRVKPTNNIYEIAAVMADKSIPEMLPTWDLLAQYYKNRRYHTTEMVTPYISSCSFYEVIYDKLRYSSLPEVKFLWDNISMPEERMIFMSKRAAPMACNSKMRCKNSIEAEEEVAEADYDNSSAFFDEAPQSVGRNNLSEVKVRKNFVETAFFYPQLTTSADGSIEFEYTAPDALTGWKMIIFAHDKKVNSCITSEELQTQMTFAVKASLPRFVRKGDKCSFASTITNNDEKEKSGDVAIFIKDIATDKIISEQSRKFKVDGNKSKVEEWSFDVPAGVAAIEVKMVGKSGTFSDGEVHQLPVLADGTHIVKSKSMHVRGGETKDFSIAYNEKEMHDAELTVEYTDNAVWQALMALPSIKDSKYDCATEYISTIYVNQMAQRIALLYPEIKSVVEEWKKEGDHAASPLEQNQELKNILLQQTPWMYEAKNESEQRAKIVELYDADRIQKTNSEAISKLQSLQQSDGGFAWFAGFNSSEYVTVAVARRLVEMHEYGVLPKDCEKMLKDAVKYIDKALAKAYKEEFGKKGSVDREWVFDVFKIRISYNKNLDKETKKILDYYVAKANKEIKEMTLYGKASFAIILNMKGDVKKAKSIVESLRQSATETEELGMYWKGNQDSWGRYGNAIATHAMLIKAFMTTGCDAKELSDLRFHLITKKETTQWSSKESSLAAIDALVGDGKATSDMKTDGNRNVATIKIGGKQIDAKRTSGNGYVKIHYGKDEFTPDLCNGIHVEQPANQEGIGGIYISYDAPYSEITSGKSGIEVKKKMYKVVIANDGDDDKEMLQEIKEGEKLKKGDKVKIVMTLRSDRDIDFVQVLDLRAACLEPVRKRPGIEWADGKLYYQSNTDSEYSMFFDRISKGTRVFEYTLHVTQSGEYTQGITKVIPHYSPAFGANSEGGKVVVE